VMVLSVSSAGSGAPVWRAGLAMSHSWKGCDRLCLLPAPKSQINRARGSPGPTLCPGQPESESIRQNCDKQPGSDPSPVPMVLPGCLQSATSGTLFPADCLPPITHITSLALHCPLCFLTATATCAHGLPQAVPSEDFDSRILALLLTCWAGNFMLASSPGNGTCQLPSSQGGCKGDCR
jgi:hypothetical protein